MENRLNFIRTPNLEGNTAEAYIGLAANPSRVEQALLEFDQRQSYYTPQQRLAIKKRFIESLIYHKRAKPGEEIYDTLNRQYREAYGTNIPYQVSDGVTLTKQ